MIAYKYRSFLNTEEHGGIALVDAAVNASEWGSAHASLTLGDCSRQVHLEFDVSDEKSLEHTRQKLGRLKAVLAGMEAAIESSVPALRAKWQERQQEKDVDIVSNNTGPVPGPRRRLRRARVPRG